MAANDMSLVVVYETGSIEVITAPDLSFNDGYAIQSEYVDMSNLDRGVFWDRNAVDMDYGGDVDSTDPDELERAQNPFGQVHQRICVISPETLMHVEAVYVRGTLALVRDPHSDYACGLVNVLVEEMHGGAQAAAEAGGQEDGFFGFDGLEGSQGLL